MAWKNYPEMQVLGHQYGEWGYEGGRKAGQACLAERKDYEGFWGANDSQTTGALSALIDAGVNIGPFTASRDMELTTAQDVLNRAFPTWTPTTQEDRQALARCAQDLHRHITLVRNDGRTSKIIVPQYFRRRWWKHLGHDLAWAIAAVDAK